MDRDERKDLEQAMSRSRKLIAYYNKRLQAWDGNEEYALADTYDEWFYNQEKYAK